MSKLARRWMTWALLLQRPSYLEGRLVELITRVLVGVVAAWIPIDGPDRRHPVKRELSQLTVSNPHQQSGPTTILPYKKRT